LLVKIANKGGYDNDLFKKSNTAFLIMAANSTFEFSET